MWRSGFSGDNSVDTSFTIVVVGSAAAEAGFETELATSIDGEVELGESSLSALQTVQDIFAFVVSYKAEIKTAFELTAAAAKLVAGLIGLKERRKVKMMLVDGDRKITIEADRRADLEKMMGVILRKSHPKIGT
jgi:hypothetical protein